MHPRHTAGQGPTSYADVAARNHSRVAETPTRLFDVACKTCGRSVVKVERLRDPEIAIIEAHLRTCLASEPLRNAPMLGEILACVHVREQTVLGAKMPRVKRSSDLATLRAFVCNRLLVRYDPAIVGRFAAWLRIVEPAKAALGLMLVEMALDHAPTGQSRWVLIGFGPEGEPLLEVHPLS
jgi:hypothetical protein